MPFMVTYLSNSFVVGFPVLLCLEVGVSGTLIDRVTKLLTAVAANLLLIFSL